MTEYFYPERMGRILALAMEEVIGREGVRAVFDLSAQESDMDEYPAPRPGRQYSFKAVTRLQESLEHLYGPQGGRGTALRIGRACFQYGLREYGSLLGVTGMAFRLLPLHTKIRSGAKSLAELFNKHTDQRVRLEEHENRLFWHIERCPLCWERKTGGPVCNLAVGLLQEAMYWLSSGKIFAVEEIACIARGDVACTIAIDQTPLS